MRDTFAIAAFAIIFDSRQQVLLCHRRDMDVWNLPGGGLKARELPTEAVVRETCEETGLNAKVDDLVGVYGKPDKDELVFAFRCHIVSGQVVPTDEADACSYFPFDALPPNTPPRQVERIRDALDHSRPVFRTQTAPSTREMLEGLGPERRVGSQLAGADSP